MADAEKKPSVEHWLGKITAYDREFKEWSGRVDKIIERYRTDKRPVTAKTSQFNILWSNVQTIMPAVFARLPKPDVSRRFRDNDPVGRVASMIIERGLEYEIDHYPDYRAAMENSVQDRFLGGRGCAWVRYEPHTKPLEGAQEDMPEDGVQITEDADEAETPEADAQEEIDYECCPVDYVNWKDFGHTYARTWEEVTAIWRRVYMDRPALIERFGEELGEKIPLDTRPEKEEKNTGGNAEEMYQACIYEIWDKTSNSAIWISKSMPDILDDRKDPLKLESFWPCPRPLYSTLTSNSLVPVPDFMLYQDQALSLDLISERIDKLIQALQVKGVYDSAVPELARLFSEAGNTDLIPVKNWQAFTEKNGLTGAIDLVDLVPIVATLNAAYEAQAQVKNQVYEIMGIADILRGATDPDETLGAQKMKGQFGGLRLKAMRGEVEQYATELLQIKAQIMCQMFQPQTLMQIAAVDQMSDQDKALIPQALELLKNQPMRNFRIEISSDSMVQMDETQEKADRMEFMKVAGAYLEGLIKMSHEAPKLVPLGVDMLKYGVTAFKVGKQLEGAIDEMANQMREEIKKAAENPQPPQPPPEIQLQQMKDQAAQQRLQAEQQADAQKFQATQQAEQQSAQMGMQMEQQRMQMEDAARQREMQMEMQVNQHQQQVQAQQVEHQNQLEAEREQMKQTLAAQIEQMKQSAAERDSVREEMFLRWKAELEAAVKVEVANIASKAKLQDAATETSTNEISSEVKQ